MACSAGADVDDVVAVGWARVWSADFGAGVALRSAILGSGAFGSAMRTFLAATVAGLLAIIVGGFGGGADLASVVEDGGVVAVVSELEAMPTFLASVLRKLPPDGPSPSEAIAIRIPPLSDSLNCPSNGRGGLTVGGMVPGADAYDTLE